MNSRHLNRELLAGLLLLAVGAGGFVFGAREASSDTDATENFFPRAVFVGLMAAGAAIAIRSFITASARFTAIPLRSCVAVTAGVLAFAALIASAGLAAAVMIAVMLCTLGSGTPRVWAGLVFGVCLAAAMFLLFVGLLGQSIKLAPGF